MTVAGEDLKKVKPGEPLRIPASALTVTSAGQVIEGGTLSSTVSITILLVSAPDVFVTTTL
mgnify:CR=1 FL=1